MPQSIPRMIKNAKSNEKKKRRKIWKRDTIGDSRMDLLCDYFVWSNLELQACISTQNVVCPKHRASFWHLHSHLYLKTCARIITPENIPEKKIKSTDEI